MNKNKFPMFRWGIIFMILLTVLNSCDDTSEELNDQQMLDLLTSGRWISSEFSNQESVSDSIELRAVVIDTILNTVEPMFPGDMFRAAIWVELIFGADQIFYNSRKNLSYFKCSTCNKFELIYDYEEDTFGRFYIEEGILNIQFRDGGEWRDAGSFPLQYLGEGNIKIKDWITLPLDTDSIQIDITHINGIEAESRDYVFDVVFRREQ